MPYKDLFGRHLFGYVLVDIPVKFPVAACRKFEYHKLIQYVTYNNFQLIIHPPMFGLATNNLILHDTLINS